MTEQQSAEPPIFPPPSFVLRYNEANPGRFRTSMDPLVMLAWHMATQPPPQPPLCLITGC